MSVMVLMAIPGDPKRLEEYAADNQDTMSEILESAKGHGVIAHRFYGSEDGQIVIIDEWPDEQSFLTFFEENGPRIGPLMEASGVTSQPQPTFLRPLETHDEHGWGA